MSKKRVPESYRWHRRTTWKKFNDLRDKGLPKMPWSIFNNGIMKALKAEK